MKEEALKLAEKLKHWSGNRDELWESADMIRKLVEQLDCAEDFIKQYQLFAELDKQGEPVAWMYKHKKHKMQELTSNQRNFDAEVIEEIPLYTAPQTKPLSDEEIENLREYHGINDWLYETSIVDFVKAIESHHKIK